MLSDISFGFVFFHAIVQSEQLISMSDSCTEDASRIEASCVSAMPWGLHIICLELAEVEGDPGGNSPTSLGLAQS